jgi:sec-independent protein translocase protein TatC
MSLGQHLEELRLRVIWCVLVVLAASAAAWGVHLKIMAILVRPHVQAISAFDQNVALNAASYFEGFMAQIKACTIVALVVTSPFLLYQAWAFVAPGLFPHERKWVMKLVVPSLLCFAGGVVFGYFVFIPTVLHYLLVLAGPNVHPVLMISNYLSAFFLLTLAMGLAFQTPIVVACLIRWQIVSVDTLLRHRKVMILVAFIVAAVITPPDPVSQILMALPLIVLYDLGMLAAAPSRRTLWSFSQFTGVIVVLIAGLVCWTDYWPVAHAAALRGQVTLAGGQLAPGPPQPVRRGVQVVAGKGALARISIGGASLYLDGPGTLLVHGSGKVTLQSGDAMAESPDEDQTVSIYAGPATVDVAGAKAEVNAPDTNTTQVAVFSGRVKVHAAGAEQEVSAGREQTYYSGGRPADLSAAEMRWQQLLAPAEGSP